MGLFVRKVYAPFVDLSVILWDNGIALLNLLTPKLKPDEVVPKGCPGYYGNWPEYVAPKEGDSRSACPMLNAMANHGILPHDGKNISFKEMNQKIRETFNFAASFCFFVPNFSARFLEKSYFSDRFDLADLSLHADNAIEHDASLTRQDVALQPDQGYPDQELVDQLLNDATGKYPDGSPRLTKADLSRALSRRRADARRTNKEYSETTFHNVFGSAKYVHTPIKVAHSVQEKMIVNTDTSTALLQCSQSSVAVSTILLPCSRRSASLRTGSQESLTDSGSRWPSSTSRYCQSREA